MDSKSRNEGMKGKRRTDDGREWQKCDKKLYRQEEQKELIQLAAAAVLRKPWFAREEVGIIPCLSSPELDKHNAYDCIALDGFQKGEIQFEVVFGLTSNTSNESRFTHKPCTDDSPRTGFT